MRISRSLAGVALACSVTLVAGCGSSSSTSSSTSAAGGTSGSPTTTGSKSTSGAKHDVCTSITDAQVEAIIGAPVTNQAVPGGGCSFSQEDPRAASVSFDSTTFVNGAADFDTAKSGLTGVIKGTGKAVTGVGDKAYLVVGSALGGSNQQGSGLVAKGGVLTQVTVVQSTGMSATDVESLTKKLLALAASA